MSRKSKRRGAAAKRAATTDLRLLAHAYVARQRRKEASVGEPWKTGKKSAGGIWVPAADDRPPNHASRLADQLGLTSLAYVVNRDRPAPDFHDE